MKILEDKYPLGSIPGQRTPGRYIDETLKKNIDILARNITKDMTYLGIISSSTLEVGTGKSVFAQQFCEAYLTSLNKAHNFKLNLTMNNIVFRPKEIIKRSFEVPRFSVVICDEWEDANYWSELGITLRQFFRKCRQLNLLILIIIPNFFQLPMSYAISRSVFFIDVRFSGEFDRGYFSFYNFAKKKSLYVRGKKQQNYGVVQPNFIGRFGDGYVVDEQEYRNEKINDLMAQEEMEKKPKITERQVKVVLFYKVYEHFKGKVTIPEIAKGFGITSRTGDAWLKEVRDSQKPENEISRDNINYLTGGTDDGGDEGENRELSQPVCHLPTVR